MTTLLMMRDMTLRPKIRANSSLKPEKSSGCICTSTHMPILGDSARRPAGNTTRKLAQESPLLRYDNKRFDESLGHSESSPNDTLSSGIRANHIGKSACAISTKAICAALFKVAVYRKVCVHEASALVKAYQDRHSWVFAVRSEAVTAPMILTSRSSATLKPSIVQIQQPLRSHCGS